MPRTPERYIWIARWDEFQHYPPDRDRPPAWIKDYTKQLADDRYLRLTDRQRALIRDLRDVFAMSHGRLRHDARMIARRRASQTRDADLIALNHTGLIEFISRPTLERRLEQLYSDSRSRARARRSRERIKNPPNPPQGGHSQNGDNPHACPECEVGGGLHAADCSHAPQKAKA